MKVVIRNGKASFVYDDALHATLGKLGRVSITRASNVEYDHERGGWMADLAPTLPGHILGPFASRTEALDEERDAIERFLAK